MPDVAFLVHLNVDDVMALPQIADEINDDLSRGGHDVISVAPWQRPTLQQSGLGSFTGQTMPPNTLGIPPNA